MEFAYPEYLAGLGMIAVLMLLNLWRFRRLRMTTSSLVLWRRLSQHAEMPASSRQRYFNLSLLAQAIAVALLTGAIAGPRTTRSLQAGRIVHLLVDRSASTCANSSGAPVFDRIRSGARTLLSLLSRADIVYCHVFPGLSGLESAGPLDAPQAREWLSMLEPTHLEADVPQAVFQVAARAAADSSRTFLFTDHPTPDLPAGVHSCAAPADPDNLSILAARCAPDADELRLFLRIANFSSRARQARWTLSDPTGRIHASNADSPIPIDPGQEMPIVLTVPRDAAAQDALKIELPDEDALSLDNHAWVFRNPARRLEISYIGIQDASLLRVLCALPGARVTLCKEPLPDCALAVFNESSPRSIPSCDSVVIAPARGIPGLVHVEENEPFIPQGPLRAGAAAVFPAADWAAKLALRRALVPVLLERTGASIILEENDTPLMVEFSLAGRISIYIGFRLADTNWPTQVSFPLFWGLVAERIRPSSDEWITLRPGAPLRVPAQGLSGVASPAGPLPLREPRGSHALLQPERVGLYRADYADPAASGNPGFFGVSLLSAAESALSAREIPFDPSSLPPAGIFNTAAALWLWRYFAFAAAVAMLASWLLWRERRK